MKNLFTLLIFLFLFSLGSCGTPSDAIKVTGYKWEVYLKNGDYATGVARSEREAEVKIKDFANSRKNTIKKQKVKPVNKYIKKSKF
jgi:hypothetical protein